MTGPDAAEWLAKFFGKYEHWVDKPGWSRSGSGPTTYSIHRDIKESFNMYPYDLQSFPKASLDGGYEAVARTPTVRGWRIHVPGSFIKANLGPRPGETPTLTQRTLDAADLEYTWGPEDFKRLGLRPFTKDSSEKAKGKAGGLVLP